MKIDAPGKRLDEDVPFVLVVHSLVLYLDHGGMAGAPLDDKSTPTPIAWRVRIITKALHPVATMLGQVMMSGAQCVGECQWDLTRIDQ